MTRNFGHGYWIGLRASSFNLRRLRSLDIDTRWVVKDRKREIDRCRESDEETEIERVTDKDRGAE